MATRTPVDEPVSIGAEWLIAQLRRLETAAASLSGSQDVTATLEVIARTLGAAIGADANTVHLVSENNDELRCSVSIGLTADLEPAVGSLLGDDLIVIEDIGSEPGWVGGTGKVAAIFSVPIRDNSGKFLGCLASYYREPHRPGNCEIELARVYARHAAATLDSAGLRERAERRRAELMSIIEQMPEGVFIARAPDGVPLLMNDAGAEIIGRPPTDITLRDYPQHVELRYPDGAPVDFRDRPTARALGGESARNRELIHVTRTGAVRRLLINYGPLYQPGGSIFGAVVIFRDVSDEKRAEEQYRTLVEQASVGIFITDLEGAYLEVNTAGCRMLGYSRDEILRMRLTELCAGDDTNDGVGAVESMLTDARLGKAVQVEWRLKRKDVAPIPVEVSATILPDARLLVITRDITERKRSEDELRVQERLLRGVSEATSRLLTVKSHAEAVQQALERLGRAARVDRVYVFEKHLHPVTSSVVCSQRYEWARESIKPKIDSPAFQNIPISTAGMARWHTVLSSGASISGPVRVLPEIERDAVATRGVQSLLVAPIFIDNVFWGFIGFDDCDTERVWSKNEEAILEAAAGTLGAAIARKRAEERFSKAFNSSPLSMTIATLKEGRYIDVNKSFLRITGYTREEVIGRAAGEIDIWVNPDDRIEMFRILTEQGFIRGLEINFRLKSGELYTGWLSSEVIEIGGEPCVLTTSIDITRRKQIEEALRASEERFSTAFNASPLPMSILKLRGGHYIDVNDAFAAVTGYSREEVIGRTANELRIWADSEDRDRIVSSLEEYGAVRDVEVRFRMRSGVIGIGLFSAEIIELGGERCVLTTTNDITERKQREEQLHSARLEWQTTFDAMTDNIMLVGVDDCLIRANRAFYERVGLSPEECIGKPVKQLVHSGSAEARECPICDLRLRGLRGAIEVPPGPFRSHPMFASIDPVVDSNGRTIAVVQVTRDLSDLYRAREEAERHRTGLMATIEQMAEGLVVCDQEGCVIHANRRAQEILGFSLEGLRSDLDGWLSAERYRDADGRPCEPAELPIHAALAGQIVVANRRLSYAKPDGSTSLLSVTASPFFNEQGRLAGAVALVRDVTEQQKEHERMQQADKLRALGQLASGVAHNFNNALAAVIGYTQLGLRKVRDPEVEKYLTVIEQSAKDAARMVERIQNFSRGRSRTDDFVPTRLSEIVYDAIEITRPRWRDDAEALGIEYDVAPTWHPGEDLLVNAEPSELREVFVNIIFNALDAMPNGGSLRITASADEASASVSFADDGAGMTEEIKRRVFEPFFTTKGLAGLGMGMSESYRIIERHGGRIDIESQLHKGATFTVTLPIAESTALQQHVSPRERAADSACVMVIDDEESVRQVLCAILIEQGHDVIQAASASEALVLLETHAVNFVFTDLAMPQTDGVAAAEEIKARRPAIKIVLMSGYGVDKAFERADSAFIDAVVSKPFSFPEIQETLQKLAGVTAVHLDRPEGSK